MLSKLTNAGTMIGITSGSSETPLVSRSVDMGDAYGAVSYAQPVTRDRSVSRATDSDAALAGVGTGTGTGAGAGTGVGQKGTSGYVDVLA